MKRVMKSMHAGVCGLVLWAAAPAGASGLYCANVEVPLASGSTLRVDCEGALYLDRLSVLRFDERIELHSTGDMTLWGTLVAPVIVLVANTNLSFGGGLFSGSPEFLPDVTATSWTGSPSAHLRVFSDLVPRPVIDPVYGAFTLTSQTLRPLTELLPIVVHEIVFTPGETLSPVPEPSRLALFALGAALVAWRICGKPGCRQGIPRKGEAVVVSR